MRRSRLVGLSLTVIAMLGGPLGAAPAGAEVCDLYPCELARDTGEFVRQEADDAVVFVGETYEDVGGLVITVVCTLFPTQPECQ
jgi:hypothetical protein